MIDLDLLVVAEGALEVAQGDLGHLRVQLGRWIDR